MMNLVVIIIIGIILADILNHASATNTLLQTGAGIWQSSVNGMLGKGTGTTAA